MLHSWMEWKKICALGLCSEETQSRLRKFGSVRFRKFLSQYATGTSVRSTYHVDLDAEDAWHLLETRLMINTTKRGKRYKDWLFARVKYSDDPPIDVIQGGASLIMRDAVREFLKREFSPRNTVSLSMPLAEGESGGTLTLEDLLPGDADPSCQAALREYEELAREHAKAAFGEMSRRERLAITAREIGVSLAHSLIEKAAGCRKSVLNSSYHGFMRRTAERLKAEYPDDDNESVLWLTLITINNVKKSVLEWAKSENACAGFFLLAGKKDHRR